MKNLFLTVIIVAILSSKKLVKGDKIPSRRWSSCGYMNFQIYCYGGLTYVEDLEAADTNLYTLDIAKFDGETTENINNNWETVIPDKHFDTESRKAPTAIVLQDGKRFLIQGGSNYNNTKYVNQTIIYDSTTKSWQSGSSYTEPDRGIRQIHFSSAVNLPNNLVGFYGGFEQLANTAIPRITATGQNMTYYKDQGIGVGFTGMEMYSPEDKSWASFSPQIGMPANYYPDSQSAILHPASGKVYYLGGFYYTPTRDELLVPFNWALTFDTKSGSWSNETLYGRVFPTNRIGHTAHLLPNSPDIIIYGGIDGKSKNDVPSLDYCFTLNLDNNSWTERSNLNIPNDKGARRYSHSSVLVNTTLFVLFGMGGEKIFQQSIIAINVTDVSNISYSATFGAANSLPGTPPASGLSKGAIGGIAAGVSIAVLAIVAAIVFCVSRKMNSTNHEMQGDDCIVEEISTDWDKIEGQYREVSPVGWNVQNSPYSTNSMDSTRVGSFPAAVSSPAFSAGVVKPSAVDPHKDYLIIKPDEK